MEKNKESREKVTPDHRIPRDASNDAVPPPSGREVRATLPVLRGAAEDAGGEPVRVVHDHRRTGEAAIVARRIPLFPLYQNCSRSLRLTTEMGSTLSESRSPELM